MSNKLIENLKEDHKHIFDFLTKLKTPYNELKKDNTSFLSFKKLLLEHLNKENTQLYPVLMRHKETNAVAKTFSEGMESIATEIVGYFDNIEKDLKKSTPEITGFEYAKTIGRITGLLKSRISNEEKVLYEEFLKY